MINKNKESISFLKDLNINKYIKVSPTKLNNTDILCETYCIHRFKNINKVSTNKVPMIGKIRKVTINEYEAKHGKKIGVYISIIPVIGDTNHSFSFTIGDENYNIEVLDSEMCESLYG